MSDSGRDARHLACAAATDDAGGPPTAGTEREIVLRTTEGEKKKRVNVDEDGNLSVCSMCFCE